QIFTDAAFSDSTIQPRHSLIEVLNAADIATNWIGNQTPEKSYEIFIKQARHSMIIDPMHSELTFQKEYDEKLLPMVHKVLTPFKNQFSVVHMMGSHWWYESRYPGSFRCYKPVIQSKHIPSNSKEEMINSYDNTVLYLDSFIDRTIKLAEKTNSQTLIIYLSDHGELLGEDNLWLHGQSGKGVSNPAMMVWYSEAFEKKNPKLIMDLKENHKKKLNLDFFFPTIMKLYGIEGLKYDDTKLWNN
ncbi:MAG TPA: phosphoethanolamine transferase, partial [Flavobacterium sp.]